MRVLVLGGTIFLGRHIVNALRRDGHDVTLFHRGEHGADLFPECERVLGDRDHDDDLARLAGRTYDWIVDPSAYVPRQVEAVYRALGERGARYCLISTVSVYCDDNDVYDETAPVQALPPGASLEELAPETYGPLKALCEAAAICTFAAARTLVVRPGLIVGPFDPSDRFTYWIARAACGGELLAPNAPEDPVQFIDARDLAEWIVRMLAGEHNGFYNATSPIGTFTIGDVVTSACRLTGDSAHPVWASAEFLAGREISMWSDMPVWTTGAAARSTRMADTTRAAAAGLTIRPLAMTVADTRDWYDGYKAPLRAGISPERERAALAAWRAANAGG